MEFCDKVNRAPKVRHLFRFVVGPNAGPTGLDSNHIWSIKGLTAVAIECRAFGAPPSPDISNMLVPFY